jgi:hypothetical protein
MTEESILTGIADTISYHFAPLFRHVKQSDGKCALLGMILELHRKRSARVASSHHNMVTAISTSRSDQAATWPSHYVAVPVSSAISEARLKQCLNNNTSRCAGAMSDLRGDALAACKLHA